MSNDSSQLKAEIQRYLVETGNYEIISNKLNQVLLQDGWIDQVREMISSEIRSSNSTNFTRILSKVEPKALSMVSEPAKDEVLTQIVAFLDEIVEKE
ncbi:Sus1p TDEL_0C05080 [Torulaspora delbrueckii]|uniref:Transcription and mRNA export factor SUS1 n=1 Tax=Torulaspora delbrueckii TaxID=4950 RepID=G8ZSA5_TORDE|nr:hypothetical protein TDEL_0C05080 [Torulaspora delbrueckii]CCE91397.1 hypothetical protein TDEL_0C05080 [Torulaspora delbrueckii]